jgi:hypothetical protein
MHLSFAQHFSLFLNVVYLSIIVANGSQSSILFSGVRFVSIVWLPLYLSKEAKEKIQTKV